MGVADFCEREMELKIPVKVHVAKGDKKSTKELYIVSYTGTYNGEGKDYILFRDSAHDSDFSTYRTFYMVDVNMFSSVTHEVWFKDGVLPYEIDGQPFVSR